MINNLDRKINLGDKEKQVVDNLVSFADKNNFDANDMESAYLAAMSGKELKGGA